MLAGAEQDWRDGQMQLVDQAGAQVLPNRRYATAEPNIASARGGLGLLQRGLHPLGDEPKLGASRHPQRRPRVMGQHENGCVIRRLLSPPALPALIRPWAADGPEHVPPENPGPESGEPELRHVIVDTRFAIGVS